MEMRIGSDLRACARASASGDHIVMGDGGQIQGRDKKSSDVRFLNTCVMMKHINNKR